MTREAPSAYAACSNPRDAYQFRMYHRPRCILAAENRIARSVERAATRNDREHVAVGRIHHLERRRVVRVHRLVHHDLVDHLGATVVYQPDLVARTEGAQAIED